MGCRRRGEGRNTCGGGMKSFVHLLLVAGMAISSSVYALQPAAATPKPAASSEPRTFPLWENGAPGALGHDESDIPTLTYFPAAHGAPTAVIIAPGGGYRGLEMNYEGRQ